MSYRISDIGQGAVTGQRVRDERVPALVDGQGA
jgi:hypothetical protein